MFLHVEGSSTFQIMFVGAILFVSTEFEALLDAKFKSDVIIVAPPLWLMGITLLDDHRVPHELTSPTRLLLFVVII